MVFIAAALWSVNERMGGRPGLDLEPFTTSFLGDYVALVLADKQAAEEAEANFPR